MDRTLLKINVAGKKTVVEFYDKEGRPHLITGTERPHPDLQKTMDELKITIAQLKGYDYNRILGKMDITFKEEVTTALNKIYLTKVDLIDIKSAKITGADDEEKTGIQIGYIMTQPDGRPTPAMNTARIPLNGDMGVEEMLLGWIPRIQKEAFDYIDGIKKAQLEMFDNENPDEENHEEG